MTAGASAAARATVLGGGVAGLAAAFGLAEHGYRVTLLESRAWLGGRAFSSSDRVTGERLDNGPHAMLGCYRAMRALLLRLGTEGAFQQDRQLALAYRTAGGHTDRLQLSGLPVPLAMPLALLRLGLPFGAKCRALWGMGCVLLGAPAHWSLGEWLRRRGQAGKPDAFLWRPLCRAIMNCEPDEASAADFLATLRQAFLGRASAAAFWLPKQPWGAVLGDAAPAALAAAGVQVRTGARVVALPQQQGRVAAIELGDGRRLPVERGDVVVSALPWFALAPLLPGHLPKGGGLRGSPITSAFFALAPAAPLLPDEGPVLALVDGDPFHFVMRTPGGDPRRFALVSGGNRCFDGMQVAAIEAAARAQLARHYPGFPAAVDATVRIRKEQLATFVAAPGEGRRRPAPGRLADGPDNLWVCGDWTATGLPATLEGACRSAEAMLQAMDAPTPAPRPAS